MRYLFLFLTLSSACVAQGPLQSEVLTPGHSFSDGDGTQITLEFRFVSADPELFESLQKDRLIRTAPQEPDLTLSEVADDELAQEGGIRLVSATTVVETQQPVFIDTLDDAAVVALLQKVQQHEQSNILFAPKVTLFNRQVATIADTTSRPFVVGLKPHGEEYSPQIQALEDGSRIVVRCRKQQNGVRIDVRARFSNVEDVQTTSAGPPETSVQVPSVSASDIQFSANVPSGKTLAVWGMRKDIRVSRQQGVPFSSVPYVSRMFKNTGVGTMTQETLLLITPRLVVDETNN